MTSAVRVFVNNHPVDVYPGASVRHALLRYSETVYQDTVAGKLVVTDRHGNRLGLGGPLEEGLRLTVEGPGGFRPGPARPAVAEVAATGTPAPHGVNGTVRAVPANGVAAGARPAGGGGGRPGPAADAAGTNGVAHGARQDGRRRRRGRRRGHRRGRPRTRPEAGRGGAAGQANGAG